jgi:hypothetical protein
MVRGIRRLEKIRKVRSTGRSRNHALCSRRTIIHVVKRKRKTGRIQINMNPQVAICRAPGLRTQVVIVVKTTSRAATDASLKSTK